VIAFTVYGIPKPKERARTVDLPNGRHITITPEQTRDWETSMLGQALAHRPATPLDGNLSLALWFYLPRPQSKANRQKYPYPNVKPDFDNLEKCIDALEGVMWTNDSRIVDSETHKRYADDGPPRVEVRIGEVQP
jgi:Holliday junction resolvase RusA-like endonuclease